MIDIDTITLSTDLKYYDYLTVEVEKEFDTSKEGNKLVYFYNYRGLRFTYYKDFNTLHIRLSPSRLIGEPLTDITYYIFEEIYNQILYELFDYIYPLELQQLNRIDYKIDYYTEQKDLYLKLLKKANLEYRYLKEKDYNSSVYLVSGSRNVNIYDKEQYCKDKHKSNEYMEKYRNCLRYEAQVKKNKIYYYKREYGIINCLWNYINPYDMNFFIDDVITPVVYQGDYYNTYWSSKILQEHYTKSMTNKLLNMQKDISIYGVQEVKKKYNPYKFNTYTKRLQAAGINPIPIPKNQGINKLENPLNILKVA